MKIPVKRQLLIDYRGERSQSEMAKLYGVTQQAWSFWEAGTFTPRPYIMKQIETAIGVPLEIIFFDAFNKREENDA